MPAFYREYTVYTDCIYGEEMLLLLVFSLVSVSKMNTCICIS